MNILDFLFPRRCVSCGSFGVFFCQKCLVKVKFIELPICPVCERPAIGGATHPGCQTRYSLDGLISACVYDGPIKAAVKRLKYKPWVTDLGEILVNLALDFYHKNTSIIRVIEQNPTLVPTPLHKSRERERGFNQSALIGKILSQKLNLEFRPDLLCRHKKTKPQAELKGKERLANIRGAFAISKPYALTPIPFVLLIDDVWTTGATLRACGQVLKRAGVKNVWALTLAR